MVPVSQLNLTIDTDRANLFGQQLSRPTSVSISEWTDFWAMVQRANNNAQEFPHTMRARDFTKRASR